MFEYTWFDRHNFTQDIRPAGPAPEGVYRLQPEDRLRMIYWGEHCTECAAPECYGTCDKYLPRQDMACRRFTYGIRRNRAFAEFPQAAQLRFRPWGKLFYQLNERAISPMKAQRIASYHRCTSAIMRLPSVLIRPFYKRYWFNQKLNGLLARYMHSGAHEASSLTFLLQVYSPHKEHCRLLVDFRNGSEYIKKLSLDVGEGYSQLCADVSDLLSLKRPAVEIYVERAQEVELVILNADFLESDLGRRSQLSAVPATKVKCVAWDLDNTLWDGILVESEPGELSLRGGVFELIRQLDERGILQVVVSKNDFAPAAEQLKALGIYDYFVGFRINWAPKSANLYALAQELNINVDTFAFVDDSPFERGEVAESLPCVRVYDENAALLSENAFDVPVTEDAKQRRQLYQTEHLRQEQQQAFEGQNVDFLRSCRLQLQPARLDSPERISRAHELVNRTNQLNLSGHRYSLEDFTAQLSGTAGQNLVFYASDRFGEYGLVAYVHYEAADGALLVTEYAMSCRVARKYMESALLAWLCQLEGCTKVQLCGVNNQKNHLLIETLEQIGFENTSSDPAALRLELADVSEIVGADIVEVKGL